MRPNDRIKVLIVHTDPLIAAGLEATLGRMREFETVLGGARLLPPADVVIADYDSGLRLIAAGSPHSRRVMILTHSDSEAKICHALEQGARGYLLLGCTLQDLAAGLRSVYLGGIALGPLVAGRGAGRVGRRARARREGGGRRRMLLGMSIKAIV